MTKTHLIEHPLLKPVLIALVSLLLYANTIGHDYTWDDQLLITENSATTQGISGLYEIWTSYAYFQDRPIYRPIPQSIQAVLWGISPNNPSLPHIFSIIIYSLCCVTLFHFLRISFKKTNEWLLLLITLLFAFHPMHTEVVANNKSLDETLSALFMLLALIFLSKQKGFYSALSVVFISLSLLSKISSVTILPLFLVPVLLNSKTLLKDKIANFFESKNLIPLILISIYCFLHFPKAVFDYDVYLLFLIAPFVLRVNNTYLKTVLTLVLTILLSQLGKWEFSILLYLIYFTTSLPSNRKEEIIQVVSAALFLIITNLIDNNSIFISFVLSAFLVVYYLEDKVSLAPKLEKLKQLIIALPIIILVLSGIFELSIKAVALYLSFAYLLFLKKKNLELKYKIIVLILFIPVLETFNFYNNYDKEFEVVEQQLFEKTIITDVSSPIFPYHNVLFAAKSEKQKLATISRIQLIYLQKLLVPYQLVHQHGTWQIQLATWKDWDVYLSIFIHIFLLWLAYYFYRQRFYIAMWGILWYFLTISIYTNIVVLLPDTLAERFLFLPSIGFSVALVSGLYYILQKFLKEEKRSFLALSMLLFPLFCYYAFKTIDRNKDWKNNYTLAVNTLPSAQNNASINAQYALELNNLIKSGQIQNKDSAEALVVQHYKKAIEIYPDFYGPQADLASYYILQAQPDSAFNYLVKATELNPDDWIYRYYLGLIYYERKKYELAITEFKAIQNNETLQSRAFEFPELLEAYEFGARCLHNIGRDPEAYTMLEEGIAIFKNKSTYILLANLYRTTGHGKEAVDVYKRLLVYSPNDQELINTILYLEQGLIY